MEPRRIELSSIEPNEKKEKIVKEPPTLRFRLELDETTQKTCPEFSYTELLKNALGQESDEDLDPNDPFARKDKDEHDKLLEIAQKFENKYTDHGAPAKKKKRRIVDEVVDIGDGYDLDDPFVDNSEVYDELVPSNITTKFGGFYINSGRLDFRSMSDEESGMGVDPDNSIEDFQVPKKKKKKRIITSDSEEMDTNHVPEGKKKRGRPKKKRDAEDITALLKKKRKKLIDNELKKKKKLEKLKGANLKKSSVSHLLNANGNSASMMNGTANPSSAATASATIATTVKAAESHQSHPTVILSDSSSDDSDDDNDSDASTPASSINREASMSSAAGPMDVTEDGRSQSPRPETAPKLPDAVAGKLLTAIEDIKMAARDSAKGKQKFFNGRVNDLLLVIENESQQHDISVRSIIFSHLAAFLPCGKNTLIKRAKKLRLSMGDEKLREPIAQLKEAISLVMPPQMEKWQAEMQTVEQLKQDRKQEGVKEPKDDHSGSGSDDGGEDKPLGALGTPGVGTPGDGNHGDRKEKRLMAPRKKFEWTDQIRRLFLEVVRIKMQVFEASFKSQPAEEYLRAFLDAEIRPLWPQGWMQTRMLFKESRLVHRGWTNTVVKPKKTPLQMVKGLPGTSSSVPNTPTSANAPPSFPTAAAGSAVKGPEKLSPNNHTSFASPPSKAATPKTSTSAMSTPSADLASVSNLLDYAGQSFLNKMKKMSPQKDADHHQAGATTGITFGASSGISTPSMKSPPHISGSTTNSMAAAATKLSPNSQQQQQQQQSNKLSPGKNIMDIFSSFAKSFPTPTPTTTMSSMMMNSLVNTSSSSAYKSQQQQQLQQHKQQQQQQQPQQKQQQNSQSMQNRLLETVMSSSLAYAMSATSSVPTVPVQHKAISSSTSKPAALQATSTPSNSLGLSRASQQPHQASILTSKSLAPTPPRPTYSAASLASPSSHHAASAAHPSPRSSAPQQQPPAKSSPAQPPVAPSAARDSIIMEISQRLKATNAHNCQALIQQLRGLTHDQLLQVKSSMDGKLSAEEKQKQQKGRPQDQSTRQQQEQQEQQRQLEIARQKKAEEKQRLQEAAARRRQQEQEQQHRVAEIQKMAAEEQARIRATKEQALRQQEAALQEAARQEAARQEAARQEAARHEAARQESMRQEAARQEAARQEKARKEAARQEAARKEAARQEAARKEAARQEAARKEAARQEAARQEAARQEAARQEAARQEAARQEAALQEKTRQEMLRREAARLKQEQQKVAAAATAYKQQDAARQQQQHLAQQQLHKLHLYDSYQRQQQINAATVSSWSSPPLGITSTSPGYSSPATSAGTFLGQPVPSSPSRAYQGLSPPPNMPQGGSPLYNSNSQPPRTSPLNHSPQSPYPPSPHHLPPPGASPQSHPHPFNHPFSSPEAAKQQHRY